MNQAELIKMYNDETREKFNEKLFERDENDIIREVQKVILSCERECADYQIKVLQFDIVENYEDIMSIMSKHEEEMYGNKKKKKINQYEYINLKDTDFKLMIVRYYIRDKKEEQCLSVYIQIPRIVNKYYFRISGNLYSAIYQIVDGSTYNNATSSSPMQNITLKTIFQPLKIPKNTWILNDVNGDPVTFINYNVYAFNKSIPAFKYLLAKFGLYETFKFVGIDCVTITKENINDADQYTIGIGKGIFVNCPKYVFDRDPVTQSLVYAICHAVYKMKDTKYEDMFTREYWLMSISSEFNNSKIEKGKSLLESLEGIYDIKTQEMIQLSYENKADIYCLIRWMIREFAALRNKDNLDISTKRVRFAEYLASLYAIKLSQGIYRLSDTNNKVNRITLGTIRKSILIRPTYLIEQIVKCNLVNYRNLVNDLDSITALKFSYKGISGIGDKSNSSVPDIYRFIHPSHLGRVDTDSSSKSDPGMTGILCPTVDLYMDSNSFSEFEEPDTWEDEFAKTMNEYKELNGRREVIISRKELLGEIKKDDERRLDELTKSIRSLNGLFRPIHRVEKTSVVEKMSRAAEPGGNVYYE